MRERRIKNGVEDWLEKADADLAAAEHLLASSFNAPWIIAFHAQQAAEKYLKAVCVRHQVHFPKTHDIATILGIVRQVDAGLAATLEEATTLTRYGAGARYPDPSPPTAGEAARAVDLAREVRQSVSGRLAEFLEGSR